MSESQMWISLKPVLVKAGLDPHRIENKVGLGTPDVNYRDGWIELKHVAKLPPRGGIVQVRHFTKLQRLWLTRRENSGGRCFVLLKVNKEWILFPGSTGAKVIGSVSRDEMSEHALILTTNKQELLRYL